MRFAGVHSNKKVGAFVVQRTLLHIVPGFDSVFGFIFTLTCWRTTAVIMMMMMMVVAMMKVSANERTNQLCFKSKPLSFHLLIRY